MLRGKTVLATQNSISRTRNAKQIVILPRKIAIANRQMLIIYSNEEKAGSVGRFEETEI